jgi:putative membrane-bound dehydrogenase-like protein
VAEVAGEDTITSTSILSVRGARMIKRFVILLGVLLSVAWVSGASDSNRLTYLDNLDPYYVSRDFPKLITPQWVGEDGVDAVVILAIDDMTESARYEKFLRPILDRLKKIDGRAPVSIMTRSIKPDDPQLQAWLKEGLSLETHTIDHPCPLLQNGDFPKAKSTFDRSVDNLSAVPNSHPVAFRFPCCDSKNTPSPRAYAEILAKTTDNGNFITIDSSVFNITTPNDPALPRNIGLNPDGTERYRRYLPFESFANYIEDYPYPYLIGKACWEFPCAVPSDWESFHIQGMANQRLLEDWKAQLDATVIKQGAMSLVFHPYGWSSPQQHVDLIDYAVSKYGKRVKFLTFREALERIEKNVTGGQPLRTAKGGDNGVRILDLNHDGYVDAVISNEKIHQTRTWNPAAKKWEVSDFPTEIAHNGVPSGAEFGIVEGDPIVTVRNELVLNCWRFKKDRWVEDLSLLNGLDLTGQVFTADHGVDRGFRFHDLDSDGDCEAIISNESQQVIFQWDRSIRRWQRLNFMIPKGAAFVDVDGHDAGLRLIDIDGDGHDDVLFSNEDHYILSLFTSMQDGWAKPVLSGKHGGIDPLPSLVRGGTNNGAWFLNRTLWVQNEDTTKLPDQVDRRPFSQTLIGVFSSSRSPQASLDSIQLRPGFKAELVATEPLVQDPIAFAWGPDGRLWVVEMGDYPLGVDGKGKPGGHVKILEDTNGDGHYTKSTLFLDGLPFPTGVMPWGKGVLITAAPNIIYAEDSKRDGKADIVKVLYSGFVEGNQQHRLNGLLPGLDNWLWGANGHSGGTVKSAQTGQSVNIRGRDFRIKPDQGLIETTTGMTQYGHTMSEWGDWFGCDNSNPMYQYILEDHYLRRNPHFAAPKPLVQVSDDPGAAPVYPISPDTPRFNDFWALHRFTSANSVVIYRDNLFGPAFEGNSFVSEPVGNLIHREVMRRDGLLYHSSRAPDEQKSEFLASFDGWFRPTMLRVGPDGALWVADMYRLVIEHPEWIPKDWQEKLDLRAGHDLGRIYRIYPVGIEPRKIPRLGALDTPALVAALDSPSGWQRDTAQQLIVQRADTAAVPALEQLFATSQRDVARLHAICALDGLGAIKPELLEKALSDPAAGIRRNAVRISEPMLQKSSQLGELVAKLASDPDPQVRLQVAFSLGEWNDPKAAETLGNIVTANRDQEFIEAAATTSLTKENIAPIAKAVASDMHLAAPSPLVLSGLLRFARAVNNTDAVVALLDQTAELRNGKPQPWQLDAAASLLDALQSSKTSFRQFVNDYADRKEVTDKLEKLLDAARTIAADPQAPKDLRTAAIALMGRGGPRVKEELSVLTSLLTPQTPTDLQTTAIAALSKSHDPTAPQALLLGWRTYSPALKPLALDALLNRTDWTNVLLGALESSKIPLADLDAIRRQRILKIQNPAQRERAEKLLAGTIKPDRQAVVDAYQPALKLKGDAKHGAEVFSKICANCHNFAGTGNAVGPDLASIGDKSPETLLVSILDPNRAVEPRYIAYIIQTSKGETLTGVLGTETATSITLLQANTPPMQILRTDLTLLRSTGSSLMPEGLESGLSFQDVADVIQHIRAPARPN